MGTEDSGGDEMKEVKEKQREGIEKKYTDGGHKDVPDNGGGGGGGGGIRTRGPPILHNVIHVYLIT